MNTQTTSSKFLVLSRGAAWETTLSPTEIREMSGRFTTWYERLRNEGKIEPGYQLGRKAKIVVGKNVITDGPFPESKEAIGGYWFIVADSLEEAADIAKGNPCLEYGATVEVRALITDSPECQTEPLD
jgi:hypothetical protein